MDDGAFIGVLGLPVLAGLVIGGLILLFGLIAAANFAITQAISRAGARARKRQ